jgi:peptide-methionine (S)-S-oxide reductase
MKKLTLKLIIFFTLMLNFLTNSQAANYEKAILAGGCFWGMQQLLSELNGVVKSEVGYSGGSLANPTYELILTGATGHAESVEVTFDPQKISYEKLLKFYFTIHNPTTLNRQENDVGSQYRSEIFYFSQEQKNIALKVIAAADKSKVFKNPVVTKVSKAGPFYRAEEYHQNYLTKNPYGYTCHHVREEWKF